MMMYASSDFSNDDEFYFLTGIEYVDYVFPPCATFYDDWYAANGSFCVHANEYGFVFSANTE